MHSENGGSVVSSEQYPFQVILCLWKETIPMPFGLKWGHEIEVGQGLV